jgi:hypothetical protein
MPRIGIKPFRPPGFSGKGDKQLEKIHGQLLNLFKKIHKNLDRDDPLSLPRQAQDQVAGVLVEFAEDLHNDIGIWRSYEQYNCEWFGTPLPLMLRPGEEVTEQELFQRRIQHFLWNLYPLFDPDELTLASDYEGLYQISEQLAEFLIEKFADVPQDSGVKKFLNEPFQWGWEVKRKLVWLGAGSYLFRLFYGDYVAEQDGLADIPTTDDFICQETTTWSGLGAIDILAGVLDITEEQRRELRSWHERHMAAYKVLSVDVTKGIMEVLNLINDAPYTIRGGEELAQFKKNIFVQGNLIPWNGEWYWSGGQAMYPRLSKNDIQQLKQAFTISMSHIAYRYCDDLVKRAREMLQFQYDEFIKYHGSDLVLYPDGLALAEDLEEQMRSYNESRRQQLLEAGKQPPSFQGKTSTNLPDQMLDEYLEMENGVAVYFNPDEGQEMMEEFNHILSGLEKRGVELTEDEEELIREFIFADAISPGFVKRVVQEYGYESIAAAFFIHPDYAEDEMFLDYLLRKYKGHFYRKRYPAISFVSTEI